MANAVQTSTYGFQVSVDTSLQLVHFAEPCGLHVRGRFLTPDAAGAVHEHALARQRIHAALHKVRELSKGAYVGVDRALKVADGVLFGAPDVDEHAVRGRGCTQRRVELCGRQMHTARAGIRGRDRAAR